MTLGPTLLEQQAKAELITGIIIVALKAISLIAGAVLISMAYQSWEVGIGAACLVFFHKTVK
jgi:putative Mn2+ efflux pump MntP